MALAQSALLTGMLAYFGWVRTRALFDYFGVNSAMLGLSTNDYLPNTFSMTLPVLIYTGLISLVVIGGAAALVTPVAARPRLATISTVALVLVGTTTGLLGLLAIRGRNLLHLADAFLPLELGAGLLLLIGAAHLASRAFERAPTLSPIALASTLVVIACTVAWSWSLYAHAAGVSGARHIEQTLPQRQAVSVYSSRRLALTGTGITPVDLTAAHAVYTVRYDGLRLLATAANGDLFLLPKRWTKGRDPVIVIHSSDGIRLDLVAGSGSSSP